MNTGKVRGALSAVAGFVPDLVAMGQLEKWLKVFAFDRRRVGNYRWY